MLGKTHPLAQADLSRLGRNYLQMGMYTEIVFPRIFTSLSHINKYNCIEVCVNKADIPALRVYEKVGFVDTGYIDSDVPDCLNLMYYFK